MNEDLMWERLKDIQMEVEQSRLSQPRLPAAAWRAARLLGLRARAVVEHAARRAPRRSARRLA